MTPEEALELIKEYASFGRVSFRGHARKRMRERNAYVEDVFEAIATATSCQEEEEETWRVPGVDTFGDELTVIVSLEGSVIIVTIF